MASKNWAEKADAHTERPTRLQQEVLMDSVAKKVDESEGSGQKAIRTDEKTPSPASPKGDNTPMNGIVMTILPSVSIAAEGGFDFLPYSGKASPRFVPVEGGVVDSAARDERKRQLANADFLAQADEQLAFPSRF